MLNNIGSVANIPAYVERVKKGEMRLMGFGHRVYKNYDPRAKIIKGGTITVAIGAPVTTRGVAINDTSQLRQEIRAGIADTLRELQAPGGQDGA